MLLAFLPSVGKPRRDIRQTDVGHVLGVQPFTLSANESFGTQEPHGPCGLMSGSAAEGGPVRPAGPTRNARVSHRVSEGGVGKPTTVRQKERGSSEGKFSRRMSHQDCHPYGEDATSVPSGSRLMVKSANTFGATRCNWRRHSTATSRISTSAPSVARIATKCRQAR